MFCIFKIIAGEKKLDYTNAYYDMLIALRQIIRCTDLHSKKLVKEYGLTGPQLILVQVIANKEEIALGSLAKEVSLSQATVTNIVERLEQRGLLARRRVEHDKRMVVVSTTPLADEILDKKPSLLDISFIRKYEKLEEWEQNLILAMLQRTARMMSGSDDIIDPAFQTIAAEKKALDDSMASGK